MSIFGLGHTVCTSSTRPSSVVEGTVIYETDSNKMLVYDGSSWVEVSDLDNTNAFPAAASDLNNFFGAWDTSWTPTFGNVTIGNGTVTGRYVQVGKIVIYYAEFALGSTSAITGDITLTLPVTRASARGGIFTAQAVDNGGQGIYSFETVPNTALLNVILLRAELSSGTYGRPTAASSTVPFTWGNTDGFWSNGLYEAA